MILKRIRDLFSNFFFFNDTATTEIYTLSLHDALPIFVNSDSLGSAHRPRPLCSWHNSSERRQRLVDRSEEHTSELQSQSNLVCRLLLEKKITPLRRRRAGDDLLTNS